MIYKFKDKNYWKRKVNVKNNLQAKNKIISYDCDGILLYIAHIWNLPFKLSYNRNELYINTTRLFSEAHVRENYKKLKRN